MSYVYVFFNSLVYELGYFINVPEFYVTWAEFYAEQDYWGKVGEIIKLCKENCGLDDYQSGERFGYIFAPFLLILWQIIWFKYSFFYSPIFTKYEKDMASVMNSTMDLFNYLSGSEQQGQQ